MPLLQNHILYLFYFIWGFVLSAYFMWLVLNSYIIICHGVVSEGYHYNKICDVDIGPAGSTYLKYRRRHACTC